MAEIYPGLREHGIFPSAPVLKKESLHDIESKCTELCLQIGNYQDYQVAESLAQSAVITHGIPAFNIYFIVKIAQLKHLSSLGEIIDQDLIKVYSMLNFAEAKLKQSNQDLANLRNFSSEADKLAPNGFKSPMVLSTINNSASIILERAEDNRPGNF